MPKCNVSLEYASQLKKYMLHFGLYEQDIANLSNTNVDVISGILSCKKGVVLKTLESIANNFGVRYYEIGNPSYPVPSVDSLPQTTIDKIEWRKRQGKPSPTKYKTINLKQQVLNVLSNYTLDSKFVPSDIFRSLPPLTQSSIKKASRITDLLGTELSKYVTKTGEKKKVEGKRGRQEEYYFLIKKPHKEL